jgi:protein-tyrosine phosphatase
MSQNIVTQNTVLFLCTGNYYRSRFAEILFNSIARQKNLDWIADSRGLRLESSNPGPISRFTLSFLEELGIRLDEPIRYPLTVTVDDFHSARHVVAVKEVEHRPMIQQFFPEWLDRVEFWRVDDVDYAGPEIAIPELRQNVVDLIERLSKEPARALP